VLRQACEFAQSVITVFLTSQCIVNASGFVGSTHVDIAGDGPVRVWVAAMYFTTATVSTVGYGRSQLGMLSTLDSDCTPL